MGSNLLLGLLGILLICAVYGSDDGVYIRGKQEGVYTVAGVEGVFQNSPSTGEHVYVDGQGNSYINQNNDQAVGRQDPEQKPNKNNSESGWFSGFFRWLSSKFVAHRNRRGTRILAGPLIINDDKVINNGKDVQVITNASGGKVIIDKFGNIFTISPDGRIYKIPADN